MLELNSVVSGYGETVVLHGLSIKAQEGRVLGLLGRNGAGKSTTLKTIVGLLKPTSGTVLFDGNSIAGKQPFEIASLGIAYVPETRDIFSSLSVLENLELAARGQDKNAGWTIEKVLGVFPRLKERLDTGGTQLSGGEQQMLAIARGLLQNPKLLILDEPTEGLAPIIVKQIHDQLQDLREMGMSMVLVEQNFGFATSLADDVAIVGRGQIVWTGSSDEIRNDHETQHLWLGV